MKSSTPPVGQPLIPEGVFASQLVEALKIGQAENEAQAESMLSAIGIEPRNGWIAGYPVTPILIDEIQKAVAGAADAGKLGMGKDEALKAVGNLQAKLGLSVTPGVGSSSGQPPPVAMAGETVTYKYTDKDGVVHFTNRYESIPKEYLDNIEMTREMVQPRPSGGTVKEETGPEVKTYAAAPAPEVINNYYYNEGPPVVTYYPPPEPYTYLYAWVPYPFWWSGFAFSGFFILHDFHRHVFFHRRSFIVSNHVAGVAKNKVFVVDPLHRTLRGNRVANRFSSSVVFKSPAVQSSARTIAARSQSRIASGGFSTAPGMVNAAPPSSVGRMQGQVRPNQGTRNTPRVGPPRNNFGSRRVSGGRTFSPPAVSGRFPNQASRTQVFSRPSVPHQGGFFRMPSNGGRGSFGGFNGSRSFMGHGGGSFRGGFGGRR